MGKFDCGVSTAGGELRNTHISGSTVGLSYDIGSGRPEPVVKYNNWWKNQTNFQNITPDSTNIFFDPMFVDEILDFHLQKFSPLIDTGDPSILDVDGSRSDIGLYGGPFGESYTYLDLPPKPPVNLTALIDTNLIKLTWNKNTEADFSYYNLYRDTTANFTIDSTKLVTSLIDTFYNQIIPKNFTTLYFKLTATDSQDNESEPSEEIGVYPVSVGEEPIIVSNYRLYQNYPNPFNPTTKIGYKLKEEGYVKLYVYDIKGELVATLVNETKSAGYYEVDFTVAQTTGLGLSSGIYIYQIMITGNNNIPVYTDMKKMILLR